MANSKSLKQKRALAKQQQSAQQSEAEPEAQPQFTDLPTKDPVSSSSQTSTSAESSVQDESGLARSLSTIQSEDALPPNPRPQSIMEDRSRRLLLEPQAHVAQESQAQSQPLSATAISATNHRLGMSIPKSSSQQETQRPDPLRTRVTASEELRELDSQLIEADEPTIAQRRNSFDKVLSWNEKTIQQTQTTYKGIPNPFYTEPLKPVSSPPKLGNEQESFKKDKKSYAYIRPKRRHSRHSSGSNGEDVKATLPHSDGKLELSLYTGPSPRKRYSSSSQSTQKGESYHLPGSYPPEPVNANQGPLDELNNPFATLLKDLNLERVYYDPELDVLNRFCLEYTELSQQTFKRGFFQIRQTSHYERIFNAMRNVTEDASTPVVDGSPPVSIPVLHYGLFLDHFRATSAKIKNPRVPLPHLTHGHRLTLDRFKSIVEGIFHRRQYLASSVGVSQQSLSDIM